MARPQGYLCPVDGAEPSLGMRAPFACKGFASTVTENAPPSCAAMRSRPQVDGDSPFPRFNLASLVVIFLASCMGQRDCHQWRGGGSSRCAGDGGDDHHPGWQAVDAMQRIETQRVQEWRKTHGLESDEDFAFAFVNWEQASVSAGSLVADSWVAARSAASDAMLHQVSEAIHDISATGASSSRPLQPRFKKVRRKTRLLPNPADSPEAVTRRVDALASVWIDCRVLRPTGRMTPELHESWKEACQRLAQRQITQAEAVTINNALKTFRELTATLSSRQRCLPPEEVDLDHFLHKGTTAPSRALASLKWLVKNGELRWPMKHVSIPASVSTRQPRRQAPVVLPPMIGHLEECIINRQAINDPTWLALLGSWMVAMGVLRYRHIQRANPRKVTLSYLHAHCPKGKQRRLRSGFDLAIPGALTCEWVWLEPWLKAWKEIPSERRQHVGLCFHPGGRAWTLEEVQTEVQACFQGHIDGYDNLTSYSWRRLGPTVGHMLGLDPQGLSALGDWQDSTAPDADAKMALHYSSAKYGESLRVKASVLGAVASLQHFDNWEAATPSAISTAKEEARRVCQAMISKDGHVVWSVPVSAHEMAKRFAVGQVLREKAARRREKAHGSEAIRAMPDQLNGKQLSSFLRNGDLLCGAFQTNRCTREESLCGAAHRCAVVCKSGRVCGGHHAAIVCREKRALRVQEPPPAQQSPLPHPEVAMPETKRRRRDKDKGESRPSVLPVIEVQEDPVPVAPAADVQTLERKFDRLATVRGKSAEAPTLIFENRQGGQIFLGGLPTAATVQHYPDADLQVVCFPESPTQKGGIVMTGAMERHISPTWAAGRTAQWRELWPLMRSSVFAGNCLLIHCMAGRHRAAVIGVITRAVFAQESADQSARWIAGRRDIQLHKITGQSGIGVWMEDTIRQTSLGNPSPPLAGYVATMRSQLHIDVGEDTPLCHHKQGAARASERLTRPMRTQDVKEAIAWGRPWCSSCVGKAPARVQMMIQEQ